MLLVWDIETAPDRTKTAGVFEFADASVVGGGKAFPKLIYHSIICIGALAAYRTDAGWEVQALGAQHVGKQSEKVLIETFVDFVAEHQPQMVTFNGHSFDLPVLRYRAIINGLSAPGLQSRSYYHRFTDDHIDVCDVLSSYNFGGKAKLDEMSRVMGLPGKPDGIDVSQVETYYNAGRINEIADYCQSDVVNTYRLWLRHELFRGRLTQDEFEYSDQSAIRSETSLTSPKDAVAVLLMPARGIKLTSMLGL